MRKEIILILFLALGIGSLMFLSFIFGRDSMQKEIRNRALKTNDIEIIIFGHKQI